MSSLNRVQLIGNLGKDPEVRYTSGGMAVTAFSVATTEKWKDKDTNEKREHTEWHRVTMFGRLAEVAGEYLSKGSKVYIEGQIRTEEWTDNDGNERKTTKIIGDKLVMLSTRLDDGRGSGNGGGRAPARGAHEGAGAPRGSQAPPTQSGFDDDDIPF